VKAKTDLRTEAIRLREKERLSLREIHVITGASKGSLSQWLKPFPLTEKEKQKRRKQSDRSHLRKDRGNESQFHQATDPKKMSRLQKAKIAEAAALFRMVVYGFNPFGSVFDGDKADWMVEVPETKAIWRVQVRWCKKANLHGLPTISLRCTEGHNQSRRFKKGEFDFLVGYDFYSDTCYVFSEKEVAHLSNSVSITEKAAETWEKLKNKPV